MNGHPAKRKSKHGTRWQAILHVDAAHGGPRREVIGTYALKREAQEAIEDRKREILRSRGIVEGTTVAELLTRYLAMVDVTETTRQRYKHDAERASAAYGDREADSVRPAEWDELFARLREGGRQDGRPGGLAVKSIRNLRTFLHGAYLWGMTSGLVAGNPIALTARLRVPKRVHPAPSLAVVQRVLTVMHERRLEGAVLLCASAGLRRGEAIAVRWSDIDLAQGTVMVGGQYVLHRGVGVERTQTKGKTAVLLPLPAPAVEALADLKRRQQTAFTIRGEAWREDRLISCRADGSPIPPDQAGAEFAKLMERHGLPGMTLHTLRHAYATELLHRRKVDVKTAQLLMRHAQPSTTLDMYVGEDFEQLTAAAHLLAGGWEEAAQTRFADSRQQTDSKSGGVVDLDARRRHLSLEPRAPLPGGGIMKRCTLCRCEATGQVHGFSVCDYHASHGEDDPPCPVCNHPRPIGRPAIGRAVDVRLPLELVDRIDDLAEADGVTRAEEIRRLLTLGLHQHRLADN